METDQKGTFRQQATILCAATSGFDDLSNILQPDKITHLMNKCYGSMEKVVSLYGGFIDNFSGDGFMVAFGIPGFHDKTPLNAINAAFDLQQKIDELNSDNELPCSVKIKGGIQSGSVLIGKIGTGDKIQNSIMGETVTLASRICNIAENGQILTDQDTYERTKDKFEYQVLEPVPIKGRKKPLPVFEVKGRKKLPIPIGLQPGRMIWSNMVGRDVEYSTLEKQFMQLINGRGSILQIVGKAGIGKSRLMAEFKESELANKVVIFEGRAVSNGKNLHFHPIIQIIKSWAGIREEDSSEESVEKLHKIIHRIYPEAVDEIFPFIATMMGYRLDGKARERLKGIEGEALENLILKNLRDLLARAATLRPIVIVIEDAHWCDTSSLIFLESLVKLVKKQRILYVLIYRPGYKESGERINNFLKENLTDYVLTIIIESLSTDQSNELISNLLHEVSLPDDINELIIERASGNPFFIEEVIRSFIDDGLIEIKNNRVSLTDNIKYANIPESIDNVILSRIERLDDKTKELLKTASVIGRNFYYKVLEEAARTIEEVDHKLEYLKDVQLINEYKTKDEVEFLFKHALAQQATYESIVEKTKKELHLKIAVSIEKVFAGRIHEFYGMLAHHYSKAGQREKTEEYLIKAGDECMRSGAASEAVIFLKQVLDMYLQQNESPDPQKIVDLQEKLFYAYYSAGQYIEADKYYDLIRSYYFKPYPNSEFRRKIYLMYCLLLRFYAIHYHTFIPQALPSDKNYKLLKFNTHIVRALTSINPRKLFYISSFGYRFVVEKKNFFKRNLLGSFHTYLIFGESIVFLFTGKFFKLGQRVLEKGEKYITEEYKEGYLSGKLGQAFLAYYAGNKIPLPDEEKVFNYSIQIGEYWFPTNYYLVSGYSHVEWGMEQHTLHFLDRLKQLSDAFENKYTLVNFHRLSGYQNIKFRKLDEMNRTTERSIELAFKTENSLVLFMTYCFRSMMFSFKKNLQEAKSNLSAAEKLLKGINIPITISQYLIAKSYLKIAEINFHEEPDSAKKILIKTTKVLVKTVQKVRGLLTEAYRLHAIAFRLNGNSNKAVKYFKRSMQYGQEFGNLELSRTYFEAGKFLRDTSNKKERINGMNGTECLIKAKSMFEEMNLQWDLNEYHTYMNR